MEIISTPPPPSSAILHFHFKSLQIYFFFEREKHSIRANFVQILLWIFHCLPPPLPSPSCRNLFLFCVARCVVDFWMIALLATCSLLYILCRFFC